MAQYDYFSTDEDASATNFALRMINSQYKRILKIVSDNRKKQDEPLRVVEIGPGKGYFAKIVVDEGHEYVGIEGNDRMASALEKQGYTIHTTYVPPLPQDLQADVIFMDQVLEHMKNRDAATTLIDECVKALRPGGQLVVSSPDVLAHGAYFFEDYTHDFPTSEHRMETLFSDYGLTIAHKEYYSLFVRGWILTRIITLLAKTAHQSGLLGLLTKKSHKITVSLLPSIMVIGRKDE